MAGEEQALIIAQYLGMIVVLALFVLGGAFIWRMLKSNIRRSEMVDAYFTSKLKQHATKFGIDLNTEMSEIQHYGFWENAPKNREEAKQRRLSNSSIAQTDLLFEALNEEENKEKK
jgi:hypothetical protein